MNHGDSRAIRGAGRQSVLASIWNNVGMTATPVVMLIEQADKQVPPADSGTANARLHQFARSPTVAMSRAGRNVTGDRAVRPQGIHDDGTDRCDDITNADMPPSGFRTPSD